MVGISKKMKSEDIQTAVKIKYDGPTKICRDVGRVVSLITIKSWIQIINKTRFINLSHSSARPSTVRTKANISKGKYRLTQKKRLSTKRLTVF